MEYSTDTLIKIKKLKIELDKLLPYSKENEIRLKKKFRLEFNYNSNHLEGNTLTYGQTELLLSFDKTSGDLRVSDIEEMKAHDVALSMVKEMARDTQRPLTEQFIKELNKIILVKPFWKEAISPNGLSTQKKIEIGKYKSMPNSVRKKNGEIHSYASPEETAAMMHDLMIWYADMLDKMHPIQLAAEFHYRFVCIHPFDDGNGRVARLIMNYILFKNNFPPVIIKTDDKHGYLTALEKADSGNRIALIEYVEKQLLWSLEVSIKAAKGANLEEFNDVEKEIEILKRKKLTKEKIFKTPKVSFELFTHINNDVWKQLNSTLEKFDDFFAESNVIHKVDMKKVTKGNTVGSGFFALASQKIKEYDILGYDVAEKNVSSIIWRRNMFSLKSASKKIDFKVSCNLELMEADYSLAFYIADSDASSNPIYNQKKEYKNYLMQDEVNDIIKLISNHLIKKIDFYD